MERTYTGIEKRLVDPRRDLLSPQEHAARLHTLNPDRARNFENEEFGGGTYRGQEYTGADVSRAIKSLLLRLNFKCSPEIIELLGKLETQHPDFLKTLSFFGFLQEDGTPRDGDSPPPSFEKIRQSFSPEQLEAAREFKKPTLIIIPEGVTFDDLIHAMNAHKTMAGQQDAHVDANAFGQMVQRANQESLKITGYRTCIVEGAREMPVQSGDDVEDTFVNRIAARKATLRSGALTLKGMDRVKVALLMLHSYRTLKPVDTTTMTLLDDDSVLSDSYFPSAVLSACEVGPQPCFDGNSSEAQDDDARFRSSVGGDVLLA